MLTIPVIIQEAVGSDHSKTPIPDLNPFCRDLDDEYTAAWTLIQLISTISQRR
jgi:hypothetical protein